MLRKYSTKDKSEIIELLRQNTPEYFASSEEQDLNNYLDNEIEDYFVFEVNAKIIGAGGINYFPEEKIARISWDLISLNYQGKGIGKELTHYRLNHLKENKKIELVIVRTTQLVYKFYEKMGFKLEKTEKDFWAKNYDLYQIVLTNQ